MMSRILLVVLLFGVPMATMDDDILELKRQILRDVTEGNQQEAMEPASISQTCAADGDCPNPDKPHPYD
ncbi:Hypp941 [Branchiostoma lanceolatum]|uniref:Hypp941 protein n=1 Tax=Branchiostoma lanceolatum TaxID=7740 RepID=A0A8J9ZFG6_BRALA|nr:Hypp941 [Branchiostoma lanceolatum]